MNFTTIPKSTRQVISYKLESTKLLVPTSKIQPFFFLGSKYLADLIHLVALLTLAEIEAVDRVFTNKGLEMLFGSCIICFWGGEGGGLVSMMEFLFELETE